MPRNTPQAPASNPPRNVRPRASAAPLFRSNGQLNRRGFRQNLNGVVTDFRDDAGRTLASMGLSANDPIFNAIINSAIRSGRDALPRELVPGGNRVVPTNTNVGNFFTPDLLTNAINTHTGSIRGDLTNQFNTQLPFDATFGVGDDFGTDIAEMILGSQFEDAQTQLNRAHDRGNLNETGFARALADLGNQRSAADGRVDGIRLDLINSFRGDQGSRRDDFTTTIGNTGLTGPRPNIDQFTQGQTGRRDTFTGGFEGRFRDAIGGESFFEPLKAINTGGTAQGSVNESGASPVILEALKKREAERNRVRGLGSSGAF